MMAEQRSKPMISFGEPWSDCPRGDIEQRREQHRQALNRLQAKQQIIARLILGSLPLLEASTQFGALLSSDKNDSRQDAEHLCREVIGWAHLALLQQDRPEKAEALSARLEQELHLHLTRQGGSAVRQLRCA